MQADPKPAARTRARAIAVPLNGEAESVAHDRPTKSVQMLPIVEIHGANRTIRRRTTNLIEAHAACIEAHGVDLPILVDETGRVVFGEDTLAAYRVLKRPMVPVIRIEGRSSAQIRTIKLWLEGFHASGEWDLEALKTDFEFVLETEPDLLPLTGWDIAEVDMILHKDSEALSDLVADATTTDQTPPPVVTRGGDIFIWPAGHRLICGNSRFPETYDLLMAGKKAQILATDPPFGCLVSSISGSHTEWKEGSGMSETESVTFFEQFLAASVAHLADRPNVCLLEEPSPSLPSTSAGAGTRSERH